MMNLDIKNYTCNGECSGCGQCCGDILNLSKEEILRIDRYLKRHKVDPTPMIKLVSYDNTCPFRDNKNKKCKIYEVRPDICRVFQCNKTPDEVVRNKEMTNKGKLPRSMRNLFFGDISGARWLYTFMGVPIYDRNDKLIGVK